MKFFKKSLGLILGAAMMLGAAIGIKPAMGMVNAENISTTYTYNNKGSAWALTNCEDKSNYWLVPSGDSPSVATFTNIFKDKVIGSDVNIQLEIATFGNGTNPSSETFSFYADSGLATAVAATGSGTLPTSSTFTKYTYTIAKANTASLSDSLYMKIVKPGKQIRLKTVNIAYVAGADTNPVTAVALDRNALTLTNGQSDKLVATLTPTDATNTNVSWKSSNSSVVTVDSNGNIKAVGVGEATITVTTESGGLTATCKVTVNAAPEVYEVTDFGIGKLLITSKDTDKKLYYLPTASTSKAPTAPTFTDYNTISKDELWTVSKGTVNGQFYIQNSSGNYLYTTSDNNGVRVGTTKCEWIYDSTNKTLKSESTSRFLGVYCDGPDWRSYTASDHTNYKGTGKGGFVFYKVINNNPTIEISGSDQVVIGQTITLDATTNKITEPLTWNSSDADVATVNNGVVTPVAMGKTNITASAQGVTSEPYSVSVYPSNANVVSVATVTAIANTFGQVDSPVKYRVVGTVSDVAAKEFKLTDSTGTVVCYQGSTPTVENGNYVMVEGTVTKFGDNAELKSLTVTGSFKVTYKVDGVQYGDPQLVFPGEKLTEPSLEPRDGYTFLGWFNGEDVWNFDDAVTSEMTLVAKWRNTKLANIENIDTSFNLAYKFKNVDTPMKKVALAANTTTYTGSITKGELTQIDYSNHMTIDGETNEILSIVYYFGSSSNAYCKTGDIRFYNGSYLVIKVLDAVANAYTIEGVKAYSTATDNPEITSKISYEKVSSTEYKIKASDTLKIARIDVVMTVPEAEKAYTEVKNCDADFRIRVSVDDMTSYVNSFAQGEISEYGIHMTSSTFADHDFNFADEDNNFVYKTSDNQKQYVIIMLGDVFSNPEILNYEFTFAPYVKYKGEMVTAVDASSKKTISLKSLVKELYANEATKANYEVLYNAFVDAGFNMD